MVDIFSQDRGVVWTSPKGTIFNLKTLESGYKRKHIGTVQENPKPKKSTTKKITDSNDTFNDLGMAGRDVNLDFIFIGEKHDSESNAFEDALCERGKSRLSLPHKGEFTVNVIDFSVKNGLVENINSTVVSVNFHETAKTNYPESKSSGKKEVASAAAKTNEITAQNLSDAVSNVAADTSRMQKFSAAYSKMMNNVSAALSTANNISLNSIMTDIMGQNVMNNAFTMTSQLQIVMSKAASLASKVKNVASDFSLSSILDSATGTSSVLGSWQTLIATLITSSSPTSSISIQKSDIDNLLINDTAATSALSALCENMVKTNFETRKEAVDTAKGLSELEQTWTEFIEEQISRIDNLNDTLIRDSGLTELVAAACGEILNQSYELKIEKIITLSEDKTVIELVFENYPEMFEESPDDAIQYFIKTNDIQDDEFFLIKRGSEVKIYV